MLYPAARQGFLDGDISWRDGVIRAALVRGYAYGATHVTMSSVTAAGGLVVAVSDPLTGKTSIGGVADADDAVFGSIAAGPPTPHLILFQASTRDGGPELPAAEQRLISLITRGENLPYPPNGRSVRLRWGDGALRIFRLGGN